MEILKLKPIFKDYIWGGNRLHDDYGFETGFDKTAEGWMLACHKDGMNTIDGGKNFKAFLTRLDLLKFLAKMRKNTRIFLFL